MLDLGEGPNALPGHEDVDDAREVCAEVSTLATAVAQRGSLDARAIGVVEAKPVGYPLKGVEGQSASYADGLAAKLPAWRRPLPFQYESTGAIPLAPMSLQQGRRRRLEKTG